jgi:hypothetical protein
VAVPLEVCLDWRERRGQACEGRRATTCVLRQRLEASKTSDSRCLDTLAPSRWYTLSTCMHIMRTALFTLLPAILPLAAHQTKPSCDRCSASYISREEGSAVAGHDLVTGSDIVGLKPRPADYPSLRLLNGPGGNGSGIRDGATYRLKTGDAKVDDHIRTPIRDEAASQADLAEC